MLLLIGYLFMSFDDFIVLFQGFFLFINDLVFLFDVIFETFNQLLQIVHLRQLFLIDFLFALQLFDSVLHALNVQLELMLNTNVLSDVGLQLPHDFLVYLGWSLDAGEVRALRSQLRLRLRVRCLRLDLRLIDVAALRVIVFIPLIAAVGRRLRLVLVLRAMLGMLVLLRWHLIVFGISSACAGTSPHRTCSSLLWSLLELVIGIIVTITIDFFFILEYALKIHPIL